MNRRIKKKLQRRLGYKSYKKYRNLVSVYTPVSRMDVMNLNHRVYLRDLVIDAINDITKIKEEQL